MIRIVKVGWKIKQMVAETQNIKKVNTNVSMLLIS